MSGKYSLLVTNDILQSMREGNKIYVLNIHISKLDTYLYPSRQSHLPGYYYHLCSIPLLIAITLVKSLPPWDPSLADFTKVLPSQGRDPSKTQTIPTNYRTEVQTSNRACSQSHHCCRNLHLHCVRDHSCSKLVWGHCRPNNWGHQCHHWHIQDTTPSRQQILLDWTTMSDTVSANSFKVQMPHPVLTRVLMELTHKQLKLISHKLTPNLMAVSCPWGHSKGHPCHIDSHGMSSRWCFVAFASRQRETKTTSNWVFPCDRCALYNFSSTGAKAEHGRHQSALK